MNDQMNEVNAMLSVILPELRRVLKMITTVIIFSILFVTGVIISIVEGAFVYDELGYVSFTPLLDCGLILTCSSALILGYLFLTKNWALSITNDPKPPRPHPEKNPLPFRPSDQHGYRPVNTPL